MKRFLVILLSIFLAMALVLTACGPGESSNTEKTAEKTAGETTEKTESTTAPAEKDLKPVTLSWYIAGDPPKNFDSVMAKANELLEKKINAKLDLQILNFGEYDTVLNTMMGSGEEFDMCFTASWIDSDYKGNSRKGAFIPMDDMINARLALKNFISEDFWNLVKIDGKIYGVPNLQLSYSQAGMRFNKKLVDKYKIDINSINSYDDITNVLQKVKDNEPEVIVATNMTEWFKDPGLNYIGPNIFVDARNWKVVEFTDTPDMKAYYTATREWNKRGFFPADIATNTDFEPYFKSGKFFMGYESIKPGVEVSLSALYPGQEFVVRATSEKTLETGSATATMTAVSATSKNPERAMDFLEIMATDREIRNIIALGLEGQDYIRVDGTNNTIEKTADGYAVMDWMLGNTFLGFALKGQPDNVNELTEQENRNAKPGALVGFDFIADVVEAELMNVEAIQKEYQTIFNYGLEDFEKVLPTYKAKMKAAGIETVIAEIQRQLDEWVAKK